MQFTTATKTAAKLRLSLMGPAGSGKTFSALKIASALSSKIAVIDTEHGSASKYADKFRFDNPHTPDLLARHVHCRADRCAAEWL